MTPIDEPIGLFVARVARNLSRSFDTDGTRNLLWHIAGRQDVCHVSVSAAVKNQSPGYVSVQVYR